MARPKSRWHGKLLRNMFRDGGSIVLLGRLEQDPDRITEFRINRSNVEAFVSAVVKEADFSPEEFASLSEAIGRLAPEPPTAAGKRAAKHADHEEF